MSSVLDRTTLAFFVISVVLGGLNFVAVRFSNRELPPFEGAALRFLLAAVLFFAWTRVRRIALPRGRGLLGAVLFGFLAFGGAYALAYWGLVRAPAALGSVAFALGPLLTLLLASLHGLERITPRALVGALIAAVGIAVLFRDELAASVPPIAVAALLGGALCAAESGVLVKYFPRSHPAATNATAMGAGTALLTVISFAAGESWRLPAQEPTIVAFSYLVASTVALFALTLYVLGRWTASATSYQFVLFPLVTVAAGAVLAGEGVGVGFVAGTLVVAVGVVVAATGARRAVAPTTVRSPAAALE